MVMALFLHKNLKSKLMSCLVVEPMNKSNKVRKMASQLKILEKVTRLQIVCWINVLKEASMWRMVSLISIFWKVLLKMVFLNWISLKMLFVEILKDRE